MEGIRRSCQAPRSAAVTDRQILFTVYNHPRPDFPGFLSHSPFHGRELPARIEVRASQGLFYLRRPDVSHCNAAGCLLLAVLQSQHVISLYNTRAVCAAARKPCNGHAAGDYGRRRART